MGGGPIESRTSLGWFVNESESFMVQDRRRFMKRVALAGTAAWVAPAVITLDAAAAQGSGTTTTTPVKVGGQTQVKTPVATGGGSGSGVISNRAVAKKPNPVTTQVRGTQLARTGVDTKLMVAGGAAAVTAGAAMHLLSSDLEDRIEAQPPTTE